MAGKYFVLSGIIEYLWVENQTNPEENQKTFPVKS
ncbi:hypothetical protein FLLO111716_03385 [Flavobacterium longum]